MGEIIRLPDRVYCDIERDGVRIVAWDLDENPGPEDHEAYMAGVLALRNSVGTTVGPLSRHQVWRLRRLVTARTEDDPHGTSDRLMPDRAAAVVADWLDLWHPELRPAIERHWETLEAFQADLRDMLEGVFRER